jgi:glycerol-3-phosphate dehydrogenase
VGAALAKGIPIEKALAMAGARVEAVELIPHIVAWTERNKTRAPIFASLQRLVRGETTPDKIIDDLMMFER